MKKWRKGPSTGLAPITAEEVDSYARSLVERGLASPLILGPHPLRRDKGRAQRSQHPNERKPS